VRVTHYLRKDLHNGSVVSVPFSMRDFLLVGVQYAPLGGIPQLEAYGLLNTWNVEQEPQRYVFGVEV
jgi:hypothetical protein